MDASSPSNSTISQEDHMLSIVMNHLQSTSLHVRLATVERFTHCVFPEGPFISKRYNMWPTWGCITRIGFWGEKHVSKNVKVAMLKEKLGLGPKYYWIVRLESPRFASRIFWLMRMLPREKFCVVPGGALLGGPFKSPRWYPTAVQIQKRNIPHKLWPPKCKRCSALWCAPEICVCFEA